MLVALQVAATVLMSLAIGQAGLASGFITGRSDLRPIHGLNALIMTVLTVVILVLAILHQRGGGPRWPVAVALILLVVEILQMTLARVGAAAPHIFLGILFVVTTTVYTSYLFRSGVRPLRRA